MNALYAPCTLCLCHVEVAQEVFSFARSAWTQIQTLMWLFSRVPPSTAEVSHRTDREWGSSCTLLRHRQRDYPGSGSWDIPARLPLPRDHVALRECHLLLLKVNQVVTSNPLQRFRLSGLHLSATNMTNTLKTQRVHVRPVSGSSMTPQSVRPRPAWGMSWSSDSPRYLSSFRDKTVTHWIFKPFPCEPSTLLRKHSALSYPCTTALLPC